MSTKNAPSAEAMARAAKRTDPETRYAHHNKGGMVAQWTPCHSALHSMW